MMLESGVEAERWEEVVLVAGWCRADQMSW